MSQKLSVDQVKSTQASLALRETDHSHSTECRENLQQLLEKNPKNIQNIIRLGKLYRQEQKHEQALNLFQKALQLKPQKIWSYIHVAIELIHFGEFAEAEQKLKKALEYSPNNFDVLMKLGELEQQRRQPEQALQYLQEALINHPQEVKPGIKIIKILWDLKQFNKAEKQLTQLLEKFPNNYEILIYSGRFARQLDQRTKALSWFRKAQEKATIPTQKLQAQWLEVEELNILGNIEQAKEIIDYIIQNNPENHDAKLVKASILRQQPSLLEATKICENILAIEPNNLDCRIELARIYSQSGQVEKAIALLEETHQLLAVNTKVLMLLGSLNQDLENWEIAEKWYQKACQEYPDNPYACSKLANLQFLLGNTTSAIQLLQEAQIKIPNSLELALKFIELQRLLGNFELSKQLLIEELEHFPHSKELLWQLCRLHMEQGNYSAALEVLDKISTDNQAVIKRTEQLRANIYFHQYDYQQAEKHFRKAIAIKSFTLGSRNQLATILMVTGRIDEARQELKLATAEFNLKLPPHKFSVPLKSHTAMITNELGINPPLMAKLQAVQQEIAANKIVGTEKIFAFGSILAEEQFYLGAALYLARELRTQGIFDQIQIALSQNSTNLPTIPKRIVQFWDESQPPPEVQKICQSWRDRNPEYEYIRFSLKSAVAFIKEHYDRQVVKAFANCDQPATQADFFRLAYLNKMGGFYADADDLCRQSLDMIVNLNPELVVLQEELAVLGNNFLGSVPGQTMIRTAFEQAVINLSDYSNESPWFATGPGLITSAVCSGLLPYLTNQDYQLWPRLLVLSQAQLRKIVHQHMPLPYKKTAKSWQNNAYQRRIKA